MSRNENPDTDRLRQLLRDGDPALDGRAPDALEFTRMRRRMLSAAEAGPAPIGFPSRVLAAAAVLVLTVALGWGLMKDGGIDPPGAMPAHPAARGPADPGPTALPVTRDARQIRFSTPGGTRVVWTLDPDFKV